MANTEDVRTCGRARQRTFIAVAAVLEIRTERVYRRTHATFEDYCQDR
jgi:hypothetical protein